MSLNACASRMRHQVQWLTPGSGSDDFGEPNPDTPLGDPQLAEVKVKSGGQLADLNMEITEEVITILCWYNPSLNNSLKVEWQGRIYNVHHVAPDTHRKGQVITARLERNG